MEKQEEMEEKNVREKCTFRKTERGIIGTLDVLLDVHYR